MKKSLVLAMAMALGVTASAYAANPFSDVPAGHWAYDSVSKLAAAGVIEGYGDTTFGGDKLMTRYEMAQIVAKAMAKGANVDKLAAEFADELQNLGVRVAKLEKKSDNVRVTGELRAHYMKKQATAINDGNSYESELRSRIILEGTINDDWTYTAMLQNTQDLSKGGKNSGEELTRFKRAFVEGKIGGVNVRAGRQDYGFGDGNVLDDDLSSDAVALSYGSKLKVEGVAAQLADLDTNYDDDALLDGAKYYGAKLEYAPTDNFALKAEYVKFKDIGKGGTMEDEGEEVVVPGGFEQKIYDIGLTYGFGDFEFTGMYIHGKGDTSRHEGNDKGWALGLSFKGADAEEPGSWGLAVNYYKQEAGTYVAHAIDGNTDFENGFRGWSVSGDYAFAKNIVGTVAYYDTKDYSDGSMRDHRLWTDVTFSF